MPTNNIAPLLQKGTQFSLLAGMEDYQMDRRYDKVFKVDTTEFAFQDYQPWIYYGAPQVTQRRAPVAFSQTNPDFNLRLIPQKYTLADSWAWEDVDDDQYAFLTKLIPSSGGAMAFSFFALYERMAAQYIFSTGFTSVSPAPGSPDGQPLFSTVHPYSATNTTSTWANRPTSNVDLSSSTYMTARTNLLNTPASNDGWNIVPSVGTRLVINPAIEAVARQLADGAWQRGSAQFDMNIGLRDGLEVIPWNYAQYGSQSSSQNWNAWMLQAKNHQLIWLNRKKYTVNAWDDENTQQHVASATCRFDMGHITLRGCYASLGAAA